jgi:putative transposase
MDAQHTKHVTYKLAYHFVWCPKYRKKILVGKLATFVEQENRRICEANTWTIGALNVQADHVHLFRESLPRLWLPRVTGSHAERHDRPRSEETFMGRCTSRSRSYYVGSVGDMSVDTVLKYIELGQD